MKKLAFLLISIALITAPFISFGEQSKAGNKPAVYGVLMYADWCGSCKALDPKIAQARKEAGLDQQDILFVRWDLTNETTQHQAEMMAAVLGLGQAYEANAGKTGFMLLFNADTGEKLARITTKYDAKEIATIIQENIKAATS